MIVTGDIYKIIFKEVQDFGIKAIYDSWNSIDAPLKDEAIVIITSTPIEPDTYWEKTFVYVSICVPDYLGKVNTVRLNELERLSALWIEDGSWYMISKSSLGIERDNALKCSYVSIKLSFEILNVK